MTDNKWLIFVPSLLNRYVVSFEIFTNLLEPSKAKKTLTYVINDYKSIGTNLYRVN